MLKSGMAYKKSGVVNWDPVDKTVLANEQVIDGKGWRSGAPVEKREIPMYYLAITKYTDELVDGLGKLEWPLQVLSMQKNWIGKSEGLRFSLKLNETLARKVHDKNDKIYVFTTRPDTIMGATFIALSADHVISKHIIKSNKKIGCFIDKHWGEPTSSEVEQSRQEKVGIDTGEFEFTQFQENAFRYGLLIMFCQDTETVLSWEFLRMMKEIFCLRKNTT